MSVSVGWGSLHALRSDTIDAPAWLTQTIVRKKVNNVFRELDATSQMLHHWRWFAFPTLVLNLFLLRFVAVSKAGFLLFLFLFGPILTDHAQCLAIVFLIFRHVVQKWVPLGALR